jgi:uncharacterized OB-fold protein
MTAKTVKPVVAEGDSISTFQVTAGATGSKFLIDIRDNKKITGIKCPSCSKVYVPPRLHCPACFVRMSEWVDLSGKGTLDTYTVVRYKEPYQPKEPPIIYGVIKLDGADTGMYGILGEVDPLNVKIGMRVEPVFKEEREASLLDIDHFKPSS